MAASGEVHRTQLAHERTYLAWWRTGLAAIAAGFAVGRVLPEVVGGTTWPYIALGTVLTASGLAAMVYGIVHYRELEAALREDREPHIGEGFVLALAGGRDRGGRRVRPARPPRSLSAASPRYRLQPLRPALPLDLSIVAIIRTRYGRDAAARRRLGTDADDWGRHGLWDDRRFDPWWAQVHRPLATA